MIFRKILLLLMIGYSGSLYWIDLLGKEALYPAHLNFPLFFNLISYNLFWAVYWGIAFIIMLTLLGSGTTVKSKTEVHIHQEKKERPVKIKLQDILTKGIKINFDKTNKEGKEYTGFGDQYVISSVSDVIRLDINQLELNNSVPMKHGK